MDVDGVMKQAKDDTEGIKIKLQHIGGRIDHV